MGLESRLTDRKKLTAAAASDNLEFYVVDTDNTTEHPDGSSFKVSKEDLKSILGIDVLLNEKNVENPSYPDIPALLADQENQTIGSVQHVIDATADVTVAEGYAYYEYLGPETGLLSNYRKLTPQEASLISINTIGLCSVQEVISSSPLVVDAQKVSFSYAGSEITTVVFNKVFTEYLKAYAALVSTHNIEIIIVNRTQQKSLIATVLNFAFSSGDNLYYTLSVNTGMNKDYLAADDVLEVKLNVSKKQYGAILINNNPFTLIKNPNNNDPLKTETLEVNDFVVNGAWDAQEFWLLAIFLGNDKDVKTNWRTLQIIEEIPLTSQGQ